MNEQPPVAIVYFAEEYIEIDDKGVVHFADPGTQGVLVDNSNKDGFVVTLAKSPDEMSRKNTFHFVPPSILRIPSA